MSVGGGSHEGVATAVDVMVVAVAYVRHATRLADLAAPLAGKALVDRVIAPALG